MGVPATGIPGACCHVEAVPAMLRFVRVPVWSAAGPAAVDFGDLRYAGASIRSFAGFRIATRPTSCPRAVPPWEPPRADLLAPR